MQIPSWWHRFGEKFYFKPGKPGERELTLTTGHCHIKILKHTREPDRFTVRAIVFNEHYGRSETSRRFNAVELATAFDVEGRDLHAGEGTPYANQFGSRWGVPGKFIREGDHLNIPCAGTGLDGDPNASIFLTKAIVYKVDRFIRTGRVD